jgi:modification target Cys-rich repeat protein
MRPIHLWLPAAAVCVFALDACGPNSSLGSDPVCSTTTFDVAGNRVATFGTSADAVKIQTFLQSTIDLTNGVNEAHDGVLAACRAIGGDLGLTDADYRPATAGEDAVTTVCTRVIAEVRTVIQAGLPSGASLQLAVTPPVCRVNLEVAGQCYARCTGSVMATAPRCNGTLVADCTGTCDASCSGTCSGGCTGNCSGTCTGTCSGTCVGQCSAGCSAMDGTGRCVGTCTGTCTGSCSAGCTGSCSGSCSAGCMGTCMGTCRGMCSVASTVRCEGNWDVQADAQCDAACRARVQAQATCTPAAVRVAAITTVTPAGQARLNTLIMSLQSHYPEFARFAQRLVVLGTQTVPTFVTSVQGAAQAAGRVSATASACIVRAGIIAADTATRLNATVQVNVQFSAAVTVQGG